jgi:hypothetical protein
MVPAISKKSRTIVTIEVNASNPFPSMDTRIPITPQQQYDVAIAIPKT